MDACRQSVTLCIYYTNGMDARGSHLVEALRCSRYVLKRLQLRQHTSHHRVRLTVVWCIDDNAVGQEGGQDVQ